MMTVINIMPRYNSKVHIVWKKIKCLKGPSYADQAVQFDCYHELKHALELLQKGKLKVQKPGGAEVKNIPLQGVSGAIDKCHFFLSILIAIYLLYIECIYIYA